MKFDINLIWAIVVLLVAGMATVYSLNKQKLERITEALEKKKEEYELLKKQCKQAYRLVRNKEWNSSL